MLVDGGMLRFHIGPHGEGGGKKTPKNGPHVYECPLTAFSNISIIFKIVSPKTAYPNMTY